MAPDTSRVMSTAQTRAIQTLTSACQQVRADTVVKATAREEGFTARSRGPAKMVPAEWCVEWPVHDVFLAVLRFAYRAVIPLSQPVKMLRDMVRSMLLRQPAQSLASVHRWCVYTASRVLRGCTTAAHTRLRILSPITQPSMTSVRTSARTQPGSMAKFDGLGRAR